MDVEDKKDLIEEKSQVKDYSQPRQFKKKKKRHKKKNKNVQEVKETTKVEEVVEGNEPLEQVFVFSDEIEDESEEDEEDTDVFVFTETKSDNFEMPVSQEKEIPTSEEVIPSVNNDVFVFVDAVEEELEKTREIDDNVKESIRQFIDNENIELEDEELDEYTEIPVEDEIEEPLLEDIQIDGSIKVNNDLEEKTMPTTAPIKPSRRKMYFSFEERVIVSVVASIILFIGACFFALQATNFGKEEEVSYSEYSDITYKVCTYEHEQNDTACYAEGAKYNALQTSKINANFNYNVNLSEGIDYKVAYHVVAISKIYSDSTKEDELAKSEDILVARTEVADFSDKIIIETATDIDYQNINKSVINEMSKYPQGSVAELEIILYVDKNNNSKAVSSLKIPLAQNDFSINKKLTSVDKEETKIPINTWTQYNLLCAILGSILLIMSVIIIIRTARLVTKATTKKSPYQTKLAQILRDYDRIIVIARNGYVSNVDKSEVKVDSFHELLDARGVLQKPIIYSRINDVKSEFIVEDTEILYRYVMKEADFQDEGGK